MSLVLKFGGSSVRDAAAIRRLVEIVRDRSAERLVVVVSAMAGVTRRLQDLAGLAPSDGAACAGIMDELAARHQEAASDLLSDDVESFMSCLAELDGVFDSLEQLVSDIAEAGQLSDRDHAAVLGCGELLSSILVSHALEGCGPGCRRLDARELIVTDSDYLSARPDMPATFAAVRQALPGVDGIALTQGFIAADAAGDPTVLGFEGSDYSAAIFAAATAADELQIWTDVDGIRSADPRLVPDTVRIPEISYEEAAQMAHLGARVLHPLTVGPARDAGIPIRVMNSSNPSCEGTLVSFGSPDERGRGIKALALLTEQDARELHIAGLQGLDGRALVSVAGSGSPAYEAEVADIVRSRCPGAPVFVSEGGLAVCAVVPASASRSLLIELHKRFFQ